jgi:hypothetical protein
MDQNDQTNISLNNRGRDVFEILAEHRKRHDINAQAAAIASESSAKQPCAPCSTTSPVHTDAVVSIDNALKICIERVRRFEQCIYTCQPTTYINP